MLPKSHRLIGMIRIEAPVLELAGGEDDDSTIGGLLASFAQRSLLANSACLSRFSNAYSFHSSAHTSSSGSVVSANIEQLARDLEREYTTLDEITA
jgi:hypothetical protein